MLRFLKRGEQSQSCDTAPFFVVKLVSLDGTTLPAYVRDALTEARDTVASQRVELRVGHVTTLNISIGMHQPQFLYSPSSGDVSSAFSSFLKQLY